MSLTIRHFKVTNTTSGHVAQSGRKTVAERAAILSQKKMITTLNEQTTIPGTPDVITSGGFVGSAHMSSKYIKLVQTHGDNGTDEIVITTRIRITFMGGTSSAKNMILYAFSDSPTKTSTNLVWHVLIADANQQTIGDYWDIDLPDCTLFPNLYLSLLLINGAWDTRTVVNETLKLCSISGDQTYYCIHPTYSSADIGDAHAICIQGYNSHIGCQTCVCVGFEDWTMSITDKDYNDVVLTIHDMCLNETHTNDTSMS